MNKKQGDMALLLAHNQGRVYDEGDVVNISLWFGVTEYSSHKTKANTTSKMGFGCSYKNKGLHPVGGYIGKWFLK